MLHLPPLAPQFWGEIGIQSPPELGDSGGHRYLNDISFDLCASSSPAKERLGEVLHSLNRAEPYRLLLARVKTRQPCLHL